MSLEAANKNKTESSVNVFQSMKVILKNHLDMASMLPSVNVRANRLGLNTAKNMAKKDYIDNDQNGGYSVHNLLGYSQWRNKSSQTAYTFQNPSFSTRLYKKVSKHIKKQGQLYASYLKPCQSEKVFLFLSGRDSVSYIRGGTRYGGCERGKGVGRSLGESLESRRAR
jgi:hypothetical protein